VKVHILKNEAAVALAVATRVTRLLAERPSAVLGLPTGNTPVRLYAELRRRHRLDKIDFSKASTFNLDEFWGLPWTHPASYRAFMEEHLFQHVNLAPRRIHFLNGMAKSAVAECAGYEAAIQRAGGLDLMILGIGTNGHIGFNEPAPSLTADTHLARLAPATRRSNAYLFDGRQGAVPPTALSMGAGTILRSRAVILMATGASKAGAVRAAVHGQVTSRMPASLLQLHRDVELVLDQAAAGRLR
jgi:glucosamine-6-phosphate deaminase